MDTKYARKRQMQTQVARCDSALTRAFISAEAARQCIAVWWGGGVCIFRIENSSDVIKITKEVKIYLSFVFCFGKILNTVLFANIKVN